MRLYKYFSAAGGIRFLQSWALRLTPADQFNDPFEMRPPIKVDTEALFLNPVEALMPELLKLFLEMVPQPIGLEEGKKKEAAKIIVPLLFRTLPPAHEAAVLELIRRTMGDAGVLQLEELQDQTARLFASSLTDFKGQLPAIMAAAQRALHESLPRHLGVVCLSRSSKSLLMWSHYGESHRGMVVEFDSRDPCFHRKRQADDEFGFLRPVHYSDTRHVLGEPEDEGQEMIALALTKALDWAYEQEVRLLWPLRLADRTVQSADGTEVCLLETPPSCVRSIVLGCKAGKDLPGRVAELLNARVDAVSHINIQAATIDDLSFGLNYSDIGNWQ